MVFNPLFLQNTSGVENIHPEKVNKLSGSGYLFSDIINVFMNAEEGESLTKLTQEFLGSAQIKENNGSPVVLSLLGETSIPVNGEIKNLQLKIEDFLPAGLKKKLTKNENDADKNITEKSLTADHKQLVQILETINQLLGIGKSEIKNDTEKPEVDLAETANLLENSDGVFLIVETADKIFNVNISKLTAEKTSDSIQETKKENGNIEKLYKIKLTAITDKTLYSNSVNENIASAQNNSQLSFLPFGNDTAETKTSEAAAKLKVFTYQNVNSENILPETSKNKIKFAQQNVESLEKNSGKEITTAETAEKIKIKNAVENSASAKITAEGINNTEVVADKIGKTSATKVSDGKTEKAETNKNVFSENIQTAKSGAEEILNPKAKTSKTELKDFEKVKEEVRVNENKIETKETKTETNIKAQGKEILHAFSKSDFKENVDNKNEVKENVLKPLEKNAKENVDENNETKINTKDFEKFVFENKENEQLNIKVTKAVKNITTIKAENTQQPNNEKLVKQNAEAKTEESGGEVKTVGAAETNDKNFSQSENFFKQSEETKNFGFDSKINTNSIKEKFTLDEPLPHSNSERIVKAAEIMKEISKFIEKQDKSTLTIKISPEDLGKLKITLDIVEHNVKANIHVENEAVKTIIEKNIVDLQTQMSKNGIQLTSVNVSLSENDQKNAKQFAGKKKSNSFDINEKNIDENEDEKIKMMGYNTVEYLA